MLFSEVYVISDKLDLATEEQIGAAENDLHTHFPHGYRDYVTTLGTGYLNERVRVLPPTEIVEKTAEYRDIETELTDSLEADGINRWDVVEQGLDLFPPERILTAVLLIDPGDGHRMVFHPDAPDDIFFIPHEDAEIYHVGRTVEDALTWFLEMGPWGVQTRVLMPNNQLVERPLWYFEPDRDRDRISFELKQSVSFAEIRAHLLNLALHSPDGTFFASEAYTNDDDGTEAEVLHLFVKEYGGAIWCNDMPPDRGGITIQITYDRARRTAGLNQFINFCRSRAVRLIGYDNRVTIL